MRYCCGEVLLNKGEQRIYFGCGYCEIEFQKLEQFLRHTLKHLDIGEDHLDEMVRDTIKQSLDDNYLGESEVLQHLEVSVEHAKFDFENVNINNTEEDTVSRSGISMNSDDVVDPNLNNTEIVETISISNDDEIVKIEEAVHESSNIKAAKNVKVKVEKTAQNDMVDGLHIKRKGPYNCEDCGKKIIRRSHFITHMRKHRGIKPFICDICGVGFAETSNLKVHRLRHLGIKKYSCSVCNKKFTSSTEVKIHMRSHTGERPYKCEYCGETYKISSQLCLHRRTQHTKERPHLCSICGKSFYKKTDLHDHLLQHAGERPYECPTCKMRFSLRHSLKQHLSIHAEVKKYKCKVCGKAFAQSAGVGSHMKTCHSNARK